MVSTEVYDYFSKITLPSGQTFLVKDAEARENIQSLREFLRSGVSYLGTTTTALTDGATTEEIYISTDDDPVYVVNGDMVNYNDVMFIWNGTQWDQLGSAGAIKALAYKDSVSATYTPTGTVTGSFQGTEGNISVSGTVATGVNVSAAAPASGETANYTPSGTVTVVPSNTTVKQVSNVGTLPSWSSSVANEILTFSWNQGTLPTTSDKTVVGGITSASFTGNGQVIKGNLANGAVTSTGKFTPAGSLSNLKFNGTTATIESK